MPIPIKGFHENKEIVEFDSSLLFLKPGTTQLRVLPAYNEKGRWFRELKEIPLYDVSGKYSPVISPSTNHQPCPFVEEGQRLYQLGGEENVKLAKEFRPRRSYLFNVIVQSLPEGNVDINNCVKVLKCGVKVYRQILDLDQDVAGGWGDITNLNKGFDIRITRTGSGRIDTEYVVKGIPKQTSVLEWLEEKGFSQELVPHNLDQMYAAGDYEELKVLLEQKMSDVAPAQPDVPFTPTSDEMPTAPVVVSSLPPTE